MNSNTQKLVSIFTQDELAALMTAMGGYINTKSKQRRSTGIEVVAFNKIVDALLVANYLNAEEVEVKPDSKAPMGSAAYKAWEAMYDSDVRAHS